MAEQVYLVRHGEADGAGAGILLGRTDLPLSPAGRAQSELLRGVVPVDGTCAYLCSPLSRVRETAAIVVCGWDVTVAIDPDLAEVDFGLWERRSADEVHRSDPESVKALSGFKLDFTFPGGESLRDFQARVVRVAERLAVIDAGTAVVFTHGGVIRALICYFLNLDPRHYLLFDVGLASVSTLHLWGNRGILTGLWQTGVGPRRAEA